MSPRAIYAMSHDDARAALLEIYGHLADPQPGAMHARLCLDNAEVLVEYEFDDDNATKPTGVLVNGAWVDADKFGDEQREEWIAAIDDETRTDNRRRLEDAQADARWAA